MLNRVAAKASAFGDMIAGFGLAMLYFQQHGYVGAFVWFVGMIIAIYAEQKSEDEQ